MVNQKLQIKILSYVVIIWMTSCLQESEQVDYMSQMKAVKDKILRDYDKTVRPTNGTNTTEVYTAFIPRQILSLDEESSIFSLDSYFFLHWFDPRLQWNSSDYSGFLQFPTDLIWVPDINVYNSHSAQVDPFHEVLLAVQSTGYVYWFPPMLTQTSCLSLSTSYPEDEVECTIIMGSWVHDGWEVNFMNHNELEMHEFLNIHPRWELIEEKAYLERNETYYECCPEPFISLHAHFPMKRRPVKEIEATRAPCILTMVLTLSIYWLPPGSSKKLLLGGILFLVLNVLLTFIAMSTQNPRLVLSGVSFAQTAMYLNVITLILQVFVVTKIASLTGPSHPPAIIIQVLTGRVGKYLLLRSPVSEDKLPLDRVRLNEDSTTSEGIKVEDEWKMFATAIDRVLFLLMAVIMIAVHHL